jgi:hypothetical protein
MTSGDSRDWGAGGRTGFSFCRAFFPLEVGAAAFAFLSFVVLLTHNRLYFNESFRFCVAL